MKEHIIKYFEVIFSDISFPETNPENKTTKRQDTVQHLAEIGSSIYRKVKL